MVELDLESGTLETSLLKSVLCFGLPTFLCCPGVHSTRRIVQRAHFGSFRCMRWHFAFCLLQSSQEKRVCDG